MKKIVLLLSLLSTTVLANPIDDNCPQHTVWGAPKLLQEGDNQYLCRAEYGVNLNYKTKVAYYVVEGITTSELVKKAPRKDDFRDDSEVPAQYRVSLKDYVGSQLDRGHMAPAADFTFDAKAMSESFLLSNMMPQNQGNNRGIWKYTEEAVRTWAASGDLYAITGTIYDEGYKTFGNGVGIPTHIYKIVIQPSKSRIIAFLYPNEKLDPKQIEKYVVSVADIEGKTGIDFSPNIPAELKELETQKSNFADWK
jgi:endonuclease G